MDWYFFVENWDELLDKEEYICDLKIIWKLVKIRRKRIVFISF